MTVALGAFLLGASGQQVSSRNVRLSVGATWRPSSAALGGLSGVVYGPAGSMGELTLVNPTQLTVNPFVAVVQGTHSAVQGQYHVPNDTLRTLAITAQHASQYRRALVCVTVDDSEAAGVASSPTTDRARLHIVDGALNAVAPGALPAVPSNTLLLGEVGIPPTGQAVTITPYNPRTTARGGILPVLNDASTLPGHAGAPGIHVGEYRDHPIYGLQRWNGTIWEGPIARPASAHIIGTGTQSIASGVWTTTLLDQVTWMEGFTQSAGKGNLIATNPGLYLFVCNVSFGNNATGRRYVRCVKNGVTANYQEVGVYPLSTNHRQQVSTIHDLAAGDYVNLDAFQDSGGALNVDRTGTAIRAVRLGGFPY